ncbi:MAG TPA: hypothetical protein VMM55_04780 [Thermohalobaculum sp.]|nr:hypothetical protein [Thermohalobaculum sp.]
MKASVALAFALSASLAMAGGAHVPPGNPNYDPPPPKEGFSYPDCYCTDSDGQRVEMGETACLRIGSRRVLARCAWSVNNPAWRPEAEGCPSV